MKNKKPLIKFSVAVLLLVGFVVTVVYMSKDKGKYEEVIKEVEIEEDGRKLSDKATISEILGIDKEEHTLLTKSEMEKIANEYEKEEGFDILGIRDRIVKDFGYFNGVAYRNDIILEEGLNEFTQHQIVQNLLGKHYIEEDIPLEIEKKINVLYTRPLILYRSSVKDEEENFKKVPLAFEFAETYLMVADTEGFIKGDTMKVGYPAVFADLRTPISKKLEENRAQMIFSVYVDENIKAKDLLKKLKNIEVTVGGVKAQPFHESDYELVKDEVIESLHEYAVHFEDDKTVFEGGVEKKYRDYLEIYRPTAMTNVMFDEPVEVLHKALGVDEDEMTVREMVNAILKNKKEYEEFMKELMNKYVLKDSEVIVSFDFDVAGLAEDLENLGEGPQELKEYYEKAGMPEVVIDGVTMPMQVSTTELVEEQGIYLRP